MTKRLFEISEDITKYNGITASFCMQAKDLNELHFMLFQKGYKKGSYKVKEFIHGKVHPVEPNELQLSLFG